MYLEFKENTIKCILNILILEIKLILLLQKYIKLYCNLSYPHIDWIKQLLYLKNLLKNCFSYLNQTHTKLLFSYIITFWTTLAMESITSQIK